MGRSPCCEKDKVKKGSWSHEEDNILVEYISKNGHGTWRSLPKLAGLSRCGKSCRLRWANYLRPDIKRGPFTHEEENTIIQLHGLFGNRWASIAAQLQGRTDNEVKNYWNSHLKKRTTIANINKKSINLSSESPSTSHMAQWESARVEAEARLSLMASKPWLLETNNDHFLKLWGSDVGQSFRKVSFGVNTHVVRPNEENGIQSVVEEEMVVGSDYSNSCELNDCSDSALKMWLDFPTGNDMGFLEDDDMSIFLQG